VPLGLLAFVVTLRVVPATTEEQPPPLDWVGFVLCGSPLAATMIFLELLQLQGGLRWTIVVAGAGATVALIAATTWWLRRTPHPILRFDALRVRTFHVSNIGGGLYRMVISAVPFLIPLLLQVGFGFSPVLSGTLLLLLFAGNVAIKPATSPLIRRFGFRAVLIGSVAAGAVIIAALGLLQATTSLLIMGALLALSGVFRSIGFSAYNSLQFADIAGTTMAGANTLSATLQQLAAGLGVAVGALLLRAGEHLPGQHATSAYAWAFAGLALIMVVPLVQAIRLPPESGAELR
jgi:hypothetical protein